uniref:Putative secreted protein n=1 Tax=Anopheles triannulatus TaxID=58253 RepID=A0A2M4B3K3_9DIPT
MVLVLLVPDTVSAAATGAAASVAAVARCILVGGGGPLSESDGLALSMMTRSMALILRTGPAGRRVAIIGSLRSSLPPTPPPAPPSPPVCATFSSGTSKAMANRIVPRPAATFGSRCCTSAFRSKAHGS